MAATIPMEYFPFESRGQILISARAADPDSLLPISNAGPITQEAEMEEESIPNYMTVEGGEWGGYDRIKSMTVTGTMHNVSTQNLARVLGGTLSSVASGSVTTELHVAMQGATIRTVRPNPTNVVITCTAPAWAAETEYELGDMLLDTGTVFECTTVGESGETEPTWQTEAGATTTDGDAVWTSRGLFAAVSGTDFVVRLAGVYIVEGGGIPDNCPINTAYSYTGYYDIDTGADDVYRTVVFEGMNARDSDQKLRITYWKCKMQLAESLELIGEGRTTLPLKIKVFADAARTSGNKLVTVEPIGGM
jgi:hypothetical protein